MIRSSTVGFAFLILLGARNTRAAPQLSTTLVVGVAGNGDRSHIGSSTGFVGGLRGELLLGRGRDVDFGLGPYVEALTTTGFSDAELGAGATLLMPVHPFLPITVSAGAYARRSEPFGWETGLSTELFWGSHGYNYDSFYALSAGIFLGWRYGIGDSREVSILGGARLDLELVALPFIVLWQAVRGGSSAK